jgi:uncharacterized repeat protein (TIGR03943 family)
VTWRTQALVLTLLSAVGLKLVLTNAYLRYVNAWMKWPITAAAIVLLLVSVHYLFDREELVTSTHAHLPKTAWLLLLPIFVVFAISPPALGAYVAERRVNTTVPKPTDDYGAIPPLPDRALVAMEVIEFVTRAHWDKLDSLHDRRVELTGFVSKDGQGDWYVTRLVIACCAADAIAWRVRVAGAAAPHRDQWVRVTGTWRDPGTKIPRGGAPVLLADGLQFIKEPLHPYA